MKIEVLSQLFEILSSIFGDGWLLLLLLFLWKLASDHVKKNLQGTRSI